jgi:DNA-binding CsgD family transcriptional regulator
MTTIVSQTRLIHSHRTVTSQAKYLATSQPKPASQTKPDSKPLNFLQGIVESLMDGIMILSDRGEVIHANGYARQLCRQMLSAETVHSPLPPQLWRSCEALLESREMLPDQLVVIEDEIRIGESGTIRVRVRWLEEKRLDRPYLLVALEDQVQSAQYRAIAEARKYGLTDRETDVWQLRRAGRTYKEIAAALYISEDTVKKHLKNIHAKRDASNWVEAQ